MGKTIRIPNTVAAATAPTGANTVELFNSFTTLPLPGQGSRATLDQMMATRYLLNVNNTQAGTVNLSRSDDGVTWFVFASQAVPAPGAPTVDSGPLDFAIQGAGYFLKSEWVNGGVNQTTWVPVQYLVLGERPSQL